MLQKYRIALLLLALACLPLSAQSTRFYVLQDEQYFKPPLADIRAPHNHMRLYRNRAVEFSNSTRNGLHTFWDAAFGGYFPFAGMRFAPDSETDAMRRRGINVFVAGSSNLLLDFDTKSSDVINTDFRLGIGVATRLPQPFSAYSLRYQFLHESSHVGDEFVLGAANSNNFRRYNVSYEAHEFMGSYDAYRRSADRLWGFSYWRGYAGWRFLLNDSFEDFSNRGRAAALKLKSRHEVQLGSEGFWRGWGRQHFFLAPQYWVLAGEVFYRDRYSLDNPQKTWSRNLVFGIVYGKYFRGGRSVQWLVNYYKGVNPHGQFRGTTIEYIGLDYRIR